MRVLIGMLLGLLLMGNVAFAAADGYGAKGAAAVEEPTVQQMLQFAIEDEYLARAEYTAVLDSFGKVRPFSNIVQSEGHHIALLEPLFTDRGWDVPADRSGDYVVVPPKFAAALAAGRQAETDNIAMYERFLQQPDLPDDVRSVFERLMAASQRHLHAFSR